MTPTRYIFAPALTPEMVRGTGGNLDAGQGHSGPRWPSSTLGLSSLAAVTPVPGRVAAHSCNLAPSRTRRLGAATRSEPVPETHRTRRSRVAHTPAAARGRHPLSLDQG